jgi:general secretion pathway protein A
MSGQQHLLKTGNEEDCKNHTKLGVGGGMYLSFYHLKKKPFHITPDPESLFLNPSNREALASLIYGVEERRGFVVITGEAGVGKTTILRSYLEKADKEHLKIVYLFNPNVSFKGLLKVIFSDLGLNPGTDDVFEMVNRLHHLLIEEYRRGNNVMLIVDEAQNMPMETLENLRMLSNLETSTDKLIQIVLVGQPEFEQMLNQSELRQLKQRVAVRSTISPFTLEESLNYIQQRLAEVSMKEGNPIFTRGGLKSIVKNAKGIPRIINILCDNALITGFGYKKKKVNKRIVREIVADLQGRRRPSHFKFAIASLAGFLLLEVLYFAPSLRDMLPLTLDTNLPLNLLSKTVSSDGESLPKQDAAIQEPLPTATEEQEPLPPAFLSVHDEIEPSPAERETEAKHSPLPVKMVSPVNTSFPVTRIVKRGDTLFTMTLEIYGFTNEGLIYWVRQHNPFITDVNSIQAGQKIVFAEPPDSGKRVKHGLARRTKSS